MSENYEDFTPEGPDKSTRWERICRAIAAVPLQYMGWLNIDCSFPLASCFESEDACDDGTAVTNAVPPVVKAGRIKRWAAALDYKAMCNEANNPSNIPDYIPKEFFGS